MTKKDYTLLADVLYRQRPASPHAQIAQACWDTTCRAFATALATTNPLFDRARFLAACGV